MSNPIAGLAVALDASEAQITFALLARRFDDFGPIFGGVLTELRDMEASQFDSQGAAFGARWAPLAPSTIRQRAKEGFGPGPILRRRGTLRDSLARQRKTADSIVEVSPFALVFGTRNPYASYHQEGTRRMSQRQVIPLPHGTLPAPVLARIAELLRNYLVEGRVRGARLQGPGR